MKTKNTFYVSTLTDLEGGTVPRQLSGSVPDPKSSVGEYRTFTGDTHLLRSILVLILFYWFISSNQSEVNVSISKKTF